MGAADATVMKRSGSSLKEELAVKEGSIGAVVGAAEVEGAEDATLSIVTLVDSVTGAREAAREVTGVEFIKVG